MDYLQVKLQYYYSSMTPTRSQAGRTRPTGLLPHPYGKEGSLLRHTMAGHWWRHFLCVQLVCCYCKSQWDFAFEPPSQWLGHVPRLTVRRPASDLQVVEHAIPSLMEVP